MNIRPFEVALIGIFAVAALVGLFYLANYQSSADLEAKLYGEKVEIWGTFDFKIMDAFIEELARSNKALEVVSYIEKDSRTFENELLNAIAEGKSPDLIILPHTLLATYRSKLQAISFETLDERTYKSRYIDGTEIFMRSDGIYGIPFAVDPLVMYWNRDIFSSSGLALPPRTWESLMGQTTKAVTRIDDDLNIVQSAVALGEYSNIAHAKDILAMLFLQSGSTLVDEINGEYSVTLQKSTESGLSTGDAVLAFYTQFGLPNKETYSWNRSMYLDRTEFVNGTLALYFGKGSERALIERDNANLNYDTATVPQGAGATTQRNYGDFYAFSIPRASQNIQGAYSVATLLGSDANTKILAHSLGLAPAQRTLYTGTTGDPFEDIVFQSALISRGWLDPSPKESNEVFRTMVEESLSGQTRIKSIVIDAVQELETLFR